MRQVRVTPVRRAGLLASAVSALAATCLVGCSLGAEPDEDETTTGEPRPQNGSGVFGQVPDVVEEVEPSVVTISLDEGGVGSGVVYDEGGVIVTNAHVVGSAEDATVTLASGEDLPGEVEAVDGVTDLAVVTVDRDLAPATFEEGLPRVGELVIALGSPLGFENSATAGIVSGLGREIPGSARQSRAMVDLIQTDASISPGNSGGALVNAEGRVVGINEAYIPPQTGAVSLGFAIPAATVEDFLGELRGVEPGDSVDVTVVRDREEQAVSVEIGELQRQ